MLESISMNPDLQLYPGLPTLTLRGRRI
jgi:hypothetical protein